MTRKYFLPLHIIYLGITRLRILTLWIEIAVGTITGWTDFAIFYTNTCFFSATFEHFLTYKLFISAEIRPLLDIGFP